MILLPENVNLSIEQWLFLAFGEALITTGLSAMLLQYTVVGGGVFVNDMGPISLFRRKRTGEGPTPMRSSLLAIFSMFILRDVSLRLGCFLSEEYESVFLESPSHSIQLHPQTHRA